MTNSFNKNGLNIIILLRFFKTTRPRGGLFFYCKVALRERLNEFPLISVGGGNVFQGLVGMFPSAHKLRLTLTVFLPL